MATLSPLFRPLKSLGRHPVVHQSSPLLTDFVESWPFNEVSGNRLASVNGNTLADNNGVTRVAGHVGYAAHFAAASSQHLTRASTATLTLGTGPWHVWLWCKFDSFPGVYSAAGFLSKRDDSVGNEWNFGIYNNGGTPNLHLLVEDASLAGGEIYFAVAADTTAWHLYEAWYDDVGHALNVAFDRGAPSSIAWSTGVRSVGADFHVGTLTATNFYLDGAVNAVGLRKRVPTSADRDLIWNGGAGRQYPFGVGGGVGTWAATLDNTLGTSPVAAGSPLPAWLPLAFPWGKLYYANGDDLTAEDGSGNPLAVWPEVLDRSNRYGRVWVETPAGGVGAGATAAITFRCGDPSVPAASAGYDTLFSKRVADGHTVALFHCDSVAANATPSAANGYSLALVGSPTVNATDGGNFRTRAPVQSFASGGSLTFNGTSQYGTVAGLLGTVPAGGCVSFWARMNSTPVGPATLFAKVNVRSGPAVTEGLEVLFPDAGQVALRVTTGGVTHEAIYSTFALPAGQWWHVVASWGSKLQLWLQGCKFAQGAYYSGAWANADGTATPATVAGRLLDSADRFAPFTLDEIEVRDVEPTRTDVLTWFNRGGLPQPYEFNRWVRSPSNPVLAPTLADEQNLVFEPRLVRLGANNYVGTYTGGNANASIFGMSSTDGKTLVKSGGRVMGYGAGGHSGDACRSFVFNDAGTLYLYFTDAIATTGGSIHYATTTDNGLTWAVQGVLLAPDSYHLGWANTAVVKVGATYYWMIEFVKVGAGQQYFTALHTSSSPTGPLALADDAFIDLTVSMGGGSISTGGLGHDGTRFRLFPHCSKMTGGVLPTAVHHFASEDGLRWEPRGGGDPVLDLDDFATLPRQDQVADTRLYEIPETGEVAMLFDIDDNHGGGLQSRICLATFSGTLADLSTEYPCVRPA